MPPDTVMEPMQPVGNVKAPFASVVAVDPSASHVTVAPFKWPLVATPDSGEATPPPPPGQAVRNAGKANAMQTRLKALGAERKAETIIKNFLQE